MTNKLKLLKNFNSVDFTEKLAIIIYQARNLLNDINSSEKNELTGNETVISNYYDEWYREAAEMFARYCVEGPCDGFTCAVGSGDMLTFTSSMSLFLDKRIHDLLMIQESVQKVHTEQSSFYVVPSPW